MYEAPTVPMSVGGILDKGFSLYGAALPKTYAIAVVGSFVSALCTPVIRAQLLADTPSSLVIFGLAILLIVVNMVVWGAIATRIDGVAHGTSLTIRQAIGAGWRRSPALFGALVLTYLLLLIGFLILIIPGVYLSVALMFANVVAVIEARGPIQSLSRSWELAKGNWWRTAITWTVTLCIMMIAYILIGIVAGIIAAVGVLGAAGPGAPVASGTPWFLTYVIQPLLTGFLMPFSYALLLSLYYDLKLRNDGTDIAERLTAAEA